MKNLLKAEEAALLALSIILNQTLMPYAWWWYWVLFLAPDISMIGYVMNPKIGAALWCNARVGAGNGCQWRGVCRGGVFI